MKIVVDSEIELRIRQPDDAEVFFSLVNSNREYLRKWLGWLDEVKDVKDSLDYIQKNIVAFEEKSAADFGIWYKGDLVGSIGISNLDKYNKKANIGYWVGEKFSGNGIVIRSVEKLVPFGFTELDLNKISILVNPQNTKSLAIPEKLGFIKEGTLKETEYVNGEFTDMVLYRMLKSEWKGL